MIKTFSHQSFNEFKITNHINLLSKAKKLDKKEKDYGYFQK